MTQRSKKKGKKDFYLYILNRIKQDNALPKDNEQNISKQNWNYYVRKLKKNNLINSISYGVWEIISFGEKYSKYKEVKKETDSALAKPNKKCEVRSKKFIRGHGYMWKIKTPVVASKKKLMKHLKKYKPVLTGNKTIKIHLKGHNVRIGRRAIIVNFNPDIYFKCDSANECHKEAVFELRSLIKRLERIMNYSLKVKGKYQFRACKKHFGDVNNDIAKEYRKNNQSVSIKQNGKEWLVIDFSHNEFIEMETTDADRNIGDMDFIITPFMNKLRDKPKILDDLEKENDRLINIVRKQQEAISYLVDKDSKSVNLDRFKY